MTSIPRLLVLAAASVPALAPPTAAQDANVLMSADSLEYLLWEAPFQLPDTLIGTRFAGDRTQRVPLTFGDGDVTLLVQWAPAPEGGETYNNVPRYELAAYELQKLFLAEPEYVVPPTAFRMVPLEWYRARDDDIDGTFDLDDESVLVVLSTSSSA